MPITIKPTLASGQDPDDELWGHLIKTIEPDIDLSDIPEATEELFAGMALKPAGTLGKKTKDPLTFVPGKEYTFKGNIKIPTLDMGLNLFGGSAINAKTDKVLAEYYGGPAKTKKPPGYHKAYLEPMIAKEKGMVVKVEKSVAAQVYIVSVTLDEYTYKVELDVQNVMQLGPKEAMIGASHILSNAIKDAILSALLHALPID